jgi:hypothetical protein
MAEQAFAFIISNRVFREGRQQVWVGMSLGPDPGLEALLYDIWYLRHLPDCF